MKLTKEEFKLIMEAVQTFPSFIGMSSVLIDNLVGENGSEEEKKEIRKHHKENVDTLKKATTIISGKLYQMESEIVELCE